MNNTQLIPVDTNTEDKTFIDVQDNWWYRDADDRASAILSFLGSLEKQFVETDPYYVTRMYQNQIFAHNSDWDANERLPKQMDIVSNYRASNRNDEISKTKLASSVDYLNNIVNNIEVNDKIVSLLQDAFDKYLVRVNGMTLPNGQTYEYSKGKKAKTTKRITSEDLEADEVLALASKYRTKKKK